LLELRLTHPVERVRAHAALPARGFAGLEVVGDRLLVFAVVRGVRLGRWVFRMLQRRGSERGRRRGWGRPTALVRMLQRRARRRARSLVTQQRAAREREEQQDRQDAFHSTESA
jgi:hypothetical protein